MWLETIKKKIIMGSIASRVLQAVRDAMTFNVSDLFLSLPDDEKTKMLPMTGHARRVDAIANHVYSSSQPIVGDIQSHRIAEAISSFHTTGSIVLHPKMRMGDVDELHRRFQSRTPP